MSISKFCLVLKHTEARRKARIGTLFLFSLSVSQAGQLDRVALVKNMSCFQQYPEQFLNLGDPTFHFHALEKEMATHSSVLAWRIPGMGEPGGLPSVGSHNQTRPKRLSGSSSSSGLLLPTLFYQQKALQLITAGLSSLVERALRWNLARHFRLKFFLKYLFCQQEFNYLH